MNNDPWLEIEIDDEPTRLSKYNTTLFTFAGELAVFDHVFVQTGETETQMTGKYVFSNLEAFQVLKDWVQENDLPQVINQNDVGQCDVDAYYHQNTADLAELDSFPEEWVV